VNFDWSFAAVVALVLLFCVIVIVTLLKRLVAQAERRVYG